MVLPAPYLEPVQELVPGFSSSLSSALPAPDLAPVQAVVPGFFSSIVVLPAPDLEPVQAVEPDGVPAQPAPARSPAMLNPARIFFSFCLSIQTPFIRLTDDTRPRSRYREKKRTYPSRLDSYFMRKFMFKQEHGGELFRWIRKKDVGKADRGTLRLDLTGTFGSGYVRGKVPWSSREPVLPRYRPATRPGTPIGPKERTHGQVFHLRVLCGWVRVR